MTTAGEKVCSRCQRRPRAKDQRYCGECHASYMRQWRAGKISVLLTPEERASLLASRRA